MKRRLFLGLIIGILLVLSSCNAQETSPTLDINEGMFNKTTVMLTEGNHSSLGSFGIKKTMEVIERDNITYAFEPTISMDVRADCIQSTEELLRKMGSDKHLYINIYTLETYDYTFINEGSVFTHLQDWKSLEYITALLYGLFGEYCNYGMVYGYANYLCNDLYSTPLDVYSDDWLYEGELNLLDINLLCFRSEFADGENLEKVKRLANTFVTSYINENSTDNFLMLLEKSGDLDTVNEFVDILAKFYASRNINYTPSDILYRLGGCSYNYIVQCKYATMYIEKGWYDVNKDVSPLTYDGFLHQNYIDTKLFFSTNIEQMGQYQERFALYPYDNNLSIYFSNTATQRSVYLPQIHVICLRHVVSFMHEYIHALTCDKMLPESWAIEGFARFFCHYYDTYGIAMMNADLNTRSLDKALGYVQEYKEVIGRDIDTSIDFHELQNIAVYSRSYDDPNDAGGYDTGSSFIGYLISVLGEAKVIEILCKTHDFGEYSYSEYVSDWNNYINEEYSGYSKIK